MFSETEEEQKAMMTAETHPSHKSSSQAGDSYLGSLLSLTSKSEIRYEGILINVNTEEASIALRNVKAFGTEGRKMDGPQVPPSEKIFEYILFRASDIKDLQVKSSPPIQSTTSVPNDPAIIESHYTEIPMTSTSLPSSGSGNESEQDLSLQTSLMGLSKPKFQGSLALDQPNADSESWGPFQHPIPSNNMSELAMPMCGGQGVYGFSNGFLSQSHQQSLPRPPSGLSTSPSMQQTMHHHPMPASYASVVASSPTPKMPSPVPRPPLTVRIPRSPSSVLAAKSPPKASDTVASLIPNKSCTQSLPHAPLNISLSVESSSTSEWDEAAIPSALLEESESIDDPVLAHLTVSDTVASLVDTPSSHHKREPTQSPVTKGQLLQSAPNALTKTQSSPTAQKDVEVVQVRSPQLTPRSAPSPVESRIHEQLSPLNSQTEQKMMCPVARYGENFEFMGMNQKFNKDDGWSDVGKNDNSWGDRGNNDNSWSDRGNNDNGWRDRGNDDNGWGDRENNDNCWGNRGNNDNSWGDRGNNDKCWADRGNNDKGWGNRGNNDKGCDRGNNDRGLSNGDRDHHDENGASKDEVKPVYVKDDFFDSLSGVPSDHGSYNSRTRFSDQMRKDSETFGYFPRQHRGGYGGQGGQGGRGVRGGRGGCGPGYNGSYNGSYNGRSRDLIMSTPKPNNTSWCVIRYQSKQCFCHLRAEIRITENGQNLGKLFYSCKFDKCRFWQWCDPITNVGLESMHYGNAKETQTTMEVKKLMTDNCELLTQNKDLKMELKKACLKSVELKTELSYAQTRLREAENLNNMLKSGIFATFVLCVIVLILVINVMSK